MFKKISIAIFVFTLSFAPLWAITPDQLKQLAGKSTDEIQASQYAQVYQGAFSYLIEQMDKTTSDTRYAHQVMLQDICLYAARPGAETQRLVMAKALANTLQSKTMTPEIRYWLLLQIERTGKAEVLDMLTESLGSADKTEQGCACAALEKNSASQATEILLKALASTKDEVCAAGLISSLGNRQDPKAIEAIGKQLDHTNHTIATAAVSALVKINTPDAISTLKQQLSPTHPAAGAIAKGLAEVAGGSAAPKANAIYNELYAWSGKVKPAASAYSIRRAALIGLAVNDSAGIDMMIIADFKAKDPAVKSMSIAAAGVTKSSRPLKAMADNSDQLDNVLLNQLIVMLAQRGESSVIMPIKHAIKSNDPLVLLTVVDALSQLNTQESAVMLLELTRYDNVQVNKYARQKLTQAPNENIDELLLKEANAGEDKQRAAAIEFLGERKTNNIELLFKYAQSDNRIVSQAALKAIGSSASAEKIPLLCQMIKKTTDENFKKAAISAINNILRESKDNKAAYAVILKELKAADKDQKPALISTLKWSDNVDAMEYCLDLLSNAEGESFQTPIPQAALEMLTFWSDPMPAKYLIERAKTSQYKLAYAQATVDLAKNMLRYDKEQAKKIAGEVKSLDMSDAINKSADKIISLR